MQKNEHHLLWVAMRRWLTVAFCVCFLLSTFCPPIWAENGADQPATDSEELEWYWWVIILVGTTVAIGVVSVLGGVGGGVLFVPILGSFFPFHMDFVRCAGLIVAMAGSLSAGSNLIRKGMVSFRLAMPAALMASGFSIAGAFVGLSLPQNVVQIALGVAILGISVLIILSRRSEQTPAESMIPTGPTSLEAKDRKPVFDISGIYHEPTLGRDVAWRATRPVVGFLLFSVIGFVAGMFGLGAGWATVPVFNLVLVAPLKISVATSQFLMSVTAPAAAWVYISQGAMLPVIVLPSIAGMMLGTRIGSRIMPYVKPTVIRYIVIGLMLAAALQSIAKGVRW